MAKKASLKIQTVWDLSPLLKSDNDPQIPQKRKKIEAAYTAFSKKWKERKDYLEDPKILKQAIDDYEQLIRNYGDGGDERYYFELKSMLDQNDPKIKAKCTEAFTFSVKMYNTIQFFSLNISKIPEDKQKKFLSDPELLPYKHFIEKLFNEGKYLLTDAEEKILNLTYTTSYEKWVSMLDGFLSKEEREVLNEQNKKTKAGLSALQGLISNRNKKVRDTAAKAMNDIYQQHILVGEHEINALLTHKKMEDELRGMERPELSRLLADDIEIEIVDQLVDAVSKENAIARKFYTLKAKLLKLPKLAYHERNIEYGSFGKNYTFEEALPIVQQTFDNLDPEFTEIFNSYFHNGQVDVFPRPGKRGGAACWHNNISQPSYVILNHTGSLHDVTTIAHEVGHGINNELTKQKQNAVNFGIVLSTAEIASQVFEDFVLEQITKELDDETRLTLNMMRLNDAVSAIFRQIACYRFEQELHKTFRQKGYLSHQEIGTIFTKYMKEYMGPAVEQSSGSQNWWINWWHIRTYFYVYSYASGLLISKYIQRKIREDKAFVEQLRYFMSAGRSESPKQIFKNMGMDITNPVFWQKGLEEINVLLRQTESLAKKLKKI